MSSPWSSVALGDPPCLGGWPLIKINSLHNNIVIVIDKYIILIYFWRKKIDERYINLLIIFIIKMEAIKWVFRKLFKTKVQTDMPIETISSYSNDIINGKKVTYKPVLNSENKVPTYKWIKGKWEIWEPELEEVNEIDWKYVSFYTQNIWFDASNSAERYSIIVQMIMESNADFIWLQEVIGPLFNAVTMDSGIQNTYYVSGNKIQGYGVLILSKLPAYFYEYKFEESLMGRSLLVAETWINNRTFLVGTSHLESMRSAPIRKIQMKIAEGKNFCFCKFKLFFL